MAYDNLCMYCFQELGGHSTCPHCGKDSHAAVPQVQMLPGTLVYHDRFLIGRALGQDASGIVYAAFDTKRENRLRIREYLPRDCAERLNDGSIVPLAGKEDEFDAGIRRLRASVEDQEEPQKRHFFFEENGTAYIVQRKSAGESHSRSEERRREEPEESGRGRAIIIAIVAAIAVVAAALALYFVFNGSLNTAKDVTETPTLDPENIWLPAESPTVTPYTSPTFAALVDPDLSWMDYTYETQAPSTGGAGTGSGTTKTVGGGAATRVPLSTARATATPKPTAVPTVRGDSSGYKTVSSKSAKADIRALQERLVTLGWLSYTDVNGSYDNTTRQAVRNFQTYINNNYNPATRLTVDGVAGPKTQQWLYQVNAARPTATPRATATPKPTATPTPKVTAAPDDDTVVDASSSAKKIRAMQRELILLGVLPEGTDSGSYDTTTRSAVRRFQTRVNQLQGYEVLEVSGRMDALSMAFLDYYVDEWRTIQTATATPGTKATPTPTPTPKATQYESEKDPDAVNAKSSREAILEVQRTLIAIGMLPEGADDGVYGASTTQAITDFQTWVNRQRNEQTLSVSGEADPRTRAYLRYCRQNGLRPYATEAPTATPVPTIEPELEEKDDFTIDRSSDRESIRRVQELLASVGLLSRRGIDGVYGNSTSNAVKAFQEYVNTQGGELEVTGIVDPSTRMTLEYYYDNGWTVHDEEQTPTPVPTEVPTEAPTEVPTEAPTAVPPIEEEEPEEREIVIDRNSDPESVAYVQRMLSGIGALDEDGVTGEYDALTAQAVADFQSWINREGIARLDETGIVDDQTRQLLENMYGQGLRMTSEEEEEPVEEDAPPAASAIDSVSIDIGGMPGDGDTIEVGDEHFNVSWSAEGDVEGYYVYVTDSAGNPMIEAEKVSDTAFPVDLDRMQPGEVYTVRVGALPAGGTRDDIVWQTARFTRPAAAAPEITDEPTPEPTDAPTPEPELQAAQIEVPEISIDGDVNEDGVVEITGSSFTLRWGAEGDVQGYNVQIVDGNGRMIADEKNITQTELPVEASKLQPGAVYTIAVGAIPRNGTGEDAVWSRSRFMVPVVVTPEPTAIPTPEPTDTPEPEPTVANVSRPSVVVDGAGYQRDGIQYMNGSTIIISWGAEGDVDAYEVYVENPNGGGTNPITTNDTSRTISTDNLDPGLYTIYVGAIPKYGTHDDIKWGTFRFAIPEPEPEVVEEPEQETEYEDIDEETGGEEESYEEEASDDATAEPERETSGRLSPIDAGSDSSEVMRLQLRLYQMGIWDDQDSEDGVLDWATLQAVAEFQSRANEQYDAGLKVIDPDNPDAVVDVNTLEWIARGL